jgi:hypothetical protein
MFLLHAVYGFGATVSPFVSTAFVQHDPDHVYFYFAVSLVLAVVTLGTLVLVFRGRTEDQVVGKRLPDDDVLSADGGVPMITTARSTAESSEAAFPSEKDAQQPADASRRPEENEGETQKIEGSGSKMRRIMQTPATHFMAFYLAIYVSLVGPVGHLLMDTGGDRGDHRRLGGEFPAARLSAETDSADIIHPRRTGRRLERRICHHRLLRR